MIEAETVIVALLDSGVSAAGLPEGALLPEVDLSGEDDGDGSGDPTGHGSAVARTLLRCAPHARILPIRLLDRYGALRDPRTIEAAFAWLVAHRDSSGLGLVCAPFADASHRLSDEDLRGGPLQTYIAALRASGVATVAPAGNAYPTHRRFRPQGMAWPAILREVVSVGEAEGHPDGLRLCADSQRLHQSAGARSHTTVFAEAGEPGGTSGAAARVAGCLAARMGLRSSAPLEQLIAELVGETEAIDPSGLRWPALAE